MTPNPVIVDQDASLDDALRILENYGFRHLPVAHNDEVLGILSDRDLRLATSMLPVERRNRDAEGAPIEVPERVAQIMRSPVFCLPPEEGPVRLAREMLDKGIGAIPIVEGGKLLGIVTETDILQAYLDFDRQERGAHDDLAVNHMHRPLSTVSPDVSVEDALERMDARIGHLGVVEDGRLAGIVSERDLMTGLGRAMLEDARAESEGRMDDARVPVSGVMTRDVITVGPEATLSHCAKGMIGYRLSALPVLEDGQPTGVLTRRDIIEYFVYTA